MRGHENINPQGVIKISIRKGYAIYRHSLYTKLRYARIQRQENDLYSLVLYKAFTDTKGNVVPDSFTTTKRRTGLTANEAVTYMLRKEKEMLKEKKHLFI